MSENFYDYMSGGKPATPETPVMDENQIGEWDTRITIYCKNPKQGFADAIKNMEGVVAVFVKSKAATDSVPKVD